jgi:hypothetical protein
VGLTLFYFISNAKQQQIAQRRFHKSKIKNRQLTEASFAKLTLESEGDVFQFYFKCKATTNRSKVISQTKNQKPLAH